MGSMAHTGTALTRAIALLTLFGCGGSERSRDPEPDAAQDQDAMGVISTSEPGDAALSSPDAALLDATLSSDANTTTPDANTTPPDAAAQPARDAGTPGDGGVVQGGRCTTHGDCVLVAKSCCTCEKTLDSVVARLRDAAASVPCSVTCGACVPTPYDPLNPWVAPACVQGQCVAHDLRKAAETSCTRDDECEVSPESASCCPTCSSDPKLYRAKRKDKIVTVDGAGCVGDVFCPACVATLPAPYCAVDGHCAVR